MADTAARREARRKRILENSHNRLQLIAGKPNDDSYKESPSRSPVPQIYDTTITTDNEPSGSYSLFNGVLGTELESPQSLPSRHDVVASGDGETVNEFAAFGPPQQPPEQSQPSLWSKLSTYKYDIALLSLLLQFVHSLFSISFENTYFFFPLIIYSVTKLVMYPNQSSSSHFAKLNVLLLLNGINQNKLQKIIKFVQLTGTISLDMSIFLFVTIITQAFYTTLKESFVT